MNTKKYMIIIKGEVKTPQVKSCRYIKTTGKWNVEFNSGKRFSYNSFNVEKLQNPIKLNSRMYRIGREGKTFFDIEEIYVFKGESNEYWHICFGSGRERSYLRGELSIEESCLNEKNAKNVFEYIKQIAKLSELRNEDTGEKILAKRFENIAFVGNDVALTKYLNPQLVQKNGRKIEYIPIFPFGCNNSQYKAVKNAMENQISVIQGPPGTGKTQTILNIIANILMQGKTVEIVSNNNSATENIYEKLSSEKYNLGFIVATLGNSENKKKFVNEQDATYPDFSSWKLKRRQGISLNSIREKSKKLKNIFDQQEELACLKQEWSQIIVELEYFNKYLEAEKINVNDTEIKKKLTAKKWMSLWQECQRGFEKKQKIGLVFKIKNLFQYGIFNFGFYQQDISKIITTFQVMYYREKERELADRILEIENHLKNTNSSLLDDMCNQSMALLKDNLADKYMGRTSRKIFTEKDLWKKSKDVLEEYPVILSTTFSSSSSLGTGIIYDYLIMDEASQVDVATGALALSCAKNVIIVGDTKQLPNVVTKNIEKQAKKIFDTFDIDEGYQFTKSFLQSILGKR